MIKNKILQSVNGFYKWDIVIFLIVLAIILLCIFGTDYKNNPKDIPYLSIGCTLTIIPFIYYIVQKIQLYSIKKRFNHNEYIICESVTNYPKWLLYVAAPIFVGAYIGIIATVILHPEVHYRRFSGENINFAILTMITMLYFFYYLVLRIKTILTNYGLRSNYKHDTLFLQVEVIQEEITGYMRTLKAYKNHNRQAKINKIPKIYKSTNDKVDTIIGSIMQNYEETKAKILETYDIYKTRRENDY